jgi:hypothetical protein
MRYLFENRNKMKLTVIRWRRALTFLSDRRPSVCLQPAATVAGTSSALWLRGVEDLACGCLVVSVSRYSFTLEDLHLLLLPELPARIPTR